MAPPISSAPLTSSDKLTFEKQALIKEGDIVIDQYNKIIDVDNPSTQRLKQILQPYSNYNEPSVTRHQCSKIIGQVYS